MFAPLSLFLFILLFIFARKVFQACLCVLLGVRLDINDEDNHHPANKANDVVLCINIIIMAINILINSFDMKDSDNIMPKPDGGNATISTIPVL